MYYQKQMIMSVDRSRDNFTLIWLKPEQDVPFKAFGIQISVLKGHIELIEQKRARNFWSTNVEIQIFA